MTPRIPCRVVPAVAVALAVAVSGCGPRARSFAVVLDEPEPARCIPIMASASGDADDILDAWLIPGYADPQAEGTTGAAGGTLRVAPADEAGLAWFEDFDVDRFVTWNGVVFEGVTRDDHVELKSEGTIEAGDGEEGEKAGAACEVPPGFEAELVATIDGPRFDGVVRRSERRYLWSGELACEVVLVCARNVTVTGVEEE